MDKEQISYHIHSFRYAKLFHEHGMLNEFIDAGFRVPDEDMRFSIYELCSLCTDVCYLGFSEDDCVSMWYFINHSMLEYYKLCREYGSKHRLKLKANPYMIEAEKFVSEVMYLHGCYGFAWHLNAKVGHAGASGLIFHTDDYFNGEFELISALLEIRAWYLDGVQRLKNILSEVKVA